MSTLSIYYYVNLIEDQLHLWKLITNILLKYFKAIQMIHNFTVHQVRKELHVIELQHLNVGKTEIRNFSFLFFILSNPSLIVVNITGNMRKYSLSISQSHSMESEVIQSRFIEWKFHWHFSYISNLKSLSYFWISDSLSAI